MTHNTREVEEVVKEFYKIFDTDNLWQGEDEWTKNVPIGNIEQWLRTTLHHQLQKARQEERERAVEIIKDELRTAPLEVQMTKGIIFASIVGRIQTDPFPTQVTE